MSELTDKQRLELLTKSIILKSQKDPKSHDEIYNQIEKEMLAVITRWRTISKPENVSTEETKELFEKLETLIPLTILNHKYHDHNNGDTPTADS